MKTTDTFRALGHSKLQNKELNMIRGGGVKGGSTPIDEDILLPDPEPDPEPVKNE